MTRRSSRLGAFSVIVGTFALFAIAACSSSSNNGSGGSTDTSTYSGFVNAFCQPMATCCGAQGLPSDGSECRALLSLGAGGTYDPAKGQACISAINSAASSNANWCADLDNATNNACNSISSSSSSGTVAAGGNCNTSSDCAAGPAGSTVVCNFPPSTTSSQTVCTVETHGKAGDGPCFGTVTAINGDTSTSNNLNVDAGSGTGPEIFCFVADGVTCDQTTSQCAALAQIGSACTDSGGCVGGAHCDFASETCAANVATGSACEEDSDCVTGDYCDTTAKTCAAQEAQGAACTTGSQCTSGNCSSSTCGASFGAAIGLAFYCGGDGGS